MSTSGRFDKLTVPRMVKTAAIAQSLDNQWLDRDLLAQAAGSGGVTEAIEARRQARVRSEYLRALLTSEQLVVNRAYLFNNQAIYADYANEGPDREAFQALIHGKAIIPYLLFEEIPDQPQESMSVAPGWAAWKEICRETAPACLRLSWDHDENRRLIERRVFLPFGNGVVDLNTLEAQGLARDFDLPLEDAEELRQRLKRVARWAFDRLFDDQPVTRELLYKEFVVAVGSAPIERRYDGTVLSQCIKQIVDLKYNTNLGDALDLFTITPSGSPRRSALQEEVRLQRSGSTRSTNADELRRLLRNLVFEAVARISEGLPTLERLQLRDVEKVRSDEADGAWQTYTTIVSELVSDPSVEGLLDAGHGLPAVVASYQRLMAQAETVVAEREFTRLTERAEAYVEIAIDIGVSSISVLVVPSRELFFEVSPDWNEAVAEFGGLVAKKVVGIAIRLGIGRHRDRMTRRRTEHTMRVLQLRMEDPQAQAVALLRDLQEQGARELPPAAPGPDWSEGEDSDQ